MLKRELHGSIVLLVMVLLIIAGDIHAQKRRVRGGIKKAGEYFVMADSLYSSGLYDSAASYFYDAGVIYENKSRWLEAVRSYQICSECHYFNNRTDTALSLANKSFILINLHHINERPEGAQDFLENLLLIGNINSSLENFDNSLKYLKIGIEFTDTLASNENYSCIIPIRASLLRFAGLVYSKQGDYGNAIVSFNKALDILVELYGDKSHVVAQTYSYLAGIYLFKEDYENAELFLSLANNIFLSLYGQTSIYYASNLLNFSALYKGIEEIEKAKKNLLLAKDIYSKEFGNNDIRIASIYNNLASIFISDSCYEIALDFYQQARKIYNNELNSKMSLVAFIDNNIGLMYYETKEYLKAIPNFQSAINTRINIYGSKHFRVAQSYYYLGQTYLGLSEFKKSLYCYQKALVAACYDFNDTTFTANPVLKYEYKAIDLFNILCGKGYVLYKLSNISQDNERYLEAASETYELALSVLDFIRTEFLSSESKIIFTGKNKQKLLNATFVFDNLRNDLNNSRLENYFEISEKLKSFILYTSLIEGKISYIAGIPDSLIKSENELKRELSSLKTSIQKLKYIENDFDSIKIADLEDKILNKTQKYDSLIRLYKRYYPKYFELKHKSSLPSVSDIKNSLDNNEVILDYLINDTLLYILTITCNEYDVIKTNIDSDLEDEVISYYRQIKKAGNDRQLIQYSKNLYDKLIFPVKELLKDKQRLIIIPDDFLGYLPFETLINNEVSERMDVNLIKLNYLINNYEIVYNYSVSLWFNARTNKTENQKLTKKYDPIIHDFVGFAPVFNDNIDVNINNSGVMDSLQHTLVERTFSTNGNKIQQLPHSREEVKQILELFKQHNCNGDIYLDQIATKHNFLMNIRDCKYVHVATHGFSNDNYPELSGLAFYPVSDLSNNNIAEGKTGIDFYSQNILFSGEMYNLDINADLIVLSACETGIGKLARGEGLLAMTRGLIYSGVNNIVFSLWKVNDEFTKDLMINFYQQILDGNSYSDALRKTKLGLINNSRSVIPKFWSSFILIGD